MTEAIILPVMMSFYSHGSERKLAAWEPKPRRDKKAEINFPPTRLLISE